MNPLPIERLRALAGHYMPSTAEIVRIGAVDDPWGGTTETETTVATTRGRLKSASTPSEVEAASRLSAQVSGVLYLPHDADILPSDRVRVDGQLYEVGGIEPRSETYAAYTKVVVGRMA